MEVNLAGIHKMFALLCYFINSTISFVQHKPALTSLYLFAVIATPLALPHINTPKEDFL